ncbi:MAG TPA: hypothetical protein VF432_08090 [Thermoanaerobaculia bacterium]
MNAETIGAVIVRVQAIEADIAALRRMIDGEALLVSDHQYLSRCFDLLTMELEAMRQYLQGLSAA